MLTFLVRGRGTLELEAHAEVAAVRWRGAGLRRGMPICTWEGGIEFMVSWEVTIFFHGVNCYIDCE